jgi:hypothetical protein
VSIARRVSSSILAFSIAITLTYSPAPDARARLKVKTLHVAKHHPRASDDNPGSRRKPLATITQAARRALRRSASGKAARILIHPGVYREGIQFHAPDETHRLGSVVFKGIGRRPVVISGSDVWKGWSNLPETNIYHHHWQYRWGETPLPPSWGNIPESRMPRVIRRREMIFVNGDPFTQVMSRRELRSTRKSFYVSENERKIYIRPPFGIDIREAKVEVAVRPYLFGANHQRDVVIRNITFQHANTPLDSSAVFFAESSGIRIENSRFLWNNWRGLGFHASNDIRVKTTIANHNGVSGLGAGTSNNLLFVDTQTSHNNWRGSRGWDTSNHDSAIRPHFIDFATGQKFAHLRDAVFRRHRSVGNLTGGLWFDTDNARITLDGVVLKNNLTHGVFVEANQGPFRVTNSIICANETGVLIQKSTDGTLNGNVIEQNLLGQILVSGTEEPRRVEDRETGEELALDAERWAFGRNKLKSLRGQYNVRTYLPPEQWQNFVDSLSSSHNDWHYAEGDPRVFRVAGGDELTFQGWKRHTGEDKDSVASTSRAQCERPQRPYFRKGAGPRGRGKKGSDSESDKEKCETHRIEAGDHNKDLEELPPDEEEICDIRVDPHSAQSEGDSAQSEVDSAQSEGKDADHRTSSPIVLVASLIALTLAIVLIFRRRKSEPPAE